MGGRKGIRPVKNRVVGCWCGCPGQGADLYMAQLMPLPLTVSCFSKIHFGFYRALLCIRGTSHGPVSAHLSVCPSVTSQSSTKRAKRRITQTTPHDSQGL